MGLVARPENECRKIELDAIVVLGCPVGVDGRASPSLVRRAALGVRLFSAGRAPRVIFSGGTTRQGMPSEATAAADAARALGLPDVAILLEPLARTTVENARFVAGLLGPAARVVIVTDDFHVRRASWIFARHFVHVEGAGAPTQLHERLGGGLRELPLLAAHAIDRALSRRR